jgi:hypothetical protein
MDGSSVMMLGLPATGRWLTIAALLDIAKPWEFLHE